MSKRVVITGMGAITPIGNSLEEFWNSIKEEKVGIDNIKSFDTENYKVKLAAEVKDFNPEEYMDKKEARRLDRFCQFAIAAAQQAVDNSKLDLDKISKERFGVIVGSGIGGLATIEKEEQKLLEKGPNRVSPLFIPTIISNMAAGNIAIRFGAKAICNTVVTACATGTNCVGEAFRVIKNGEADIMLAGGTEAAITPIAIAGFTTLTALSKSTDPKRASIPFDKERDGFVMGEGSGILVLESLDHALERGAKIYGEVVGYGSTCDAYHMTSPAPGGEGAARAIELAIKEAGINKEEVSYINAHGTSTPYNDKFETEAIKRVFGDYSASIPVSSTKSMIGHLLGAAGAVEAIICAKSLEEGYIPATVGYNVKDEECDLDYVTSGGRNKIIDYAMSNSLGFGGHNAVILLKKWGE
ncbi:beta-ketoacyl-ACP synthase II [Clostridium botulinum]|uniref:3-oxoacyl-[acyl-carrier-protein] synthase 2 n=1 Tax=Clostridium botulinum (strain Okra / Type B1) TaxID=498213 RepID=B1IH52_CLOBK|nr:beta-ketoacyl-ACP synthase II [Clostridium botulinum]EKX80159.1 3-oxoacyl-(acyl carrier protein) synthase II [Clostridium botulinum CFSAN001628]ACA46074.1 beta-ketoacyl-acyl-carrier-protein synthase II [Clostridium botulinum B1 str. Okra]MBD5563185.1 beta-ketoacyl-ACP synthase II [Clostridium botulinum]MBD5568156.1 beta-ketoacyl-ACP synthase II [Clostridium botulinum]MBD5571886.1 beta-ketoacyl-ACP synthase II [Clostridium botulinum]